ncbi:hypothetical protein BIT28_03295 [Photobacterium proteolyticum]|uniref:Endonuclease GajA/Old nuclease/RecF-like AAA domain-containing protein n=1 Tax=Photobacterium proteolyticum TaxID=1903952 RepID=A0A1Q9GA63_9GAMM|nr:AAA family ATPase [Photobacterium proteolyticum]OLQ71205.1 hypothetical protein BIT28_03295 [Photobacterium proteolyticum]
MIVGLFLSNYKCYENGHFISFSEHGVSNFNILIGDNGVGKSSILDALNCILNNVEAKKWETTVGKKNDRTSIFPVFLIEKKLFKGSSKYNKQYNSISDAFWNFDFTQYQTNDNAKSFIALRERIKSDVNTEDYYLFAIGKNKKNDILMTTLFDSKVRNLTRKDSVSKEVVNQLYKDILSHYSYIYFPIESQVNEFLNLQAKELQSLMDKSVVDEIKQLLDKKDITVDTENPRKAKKSIISIINDKLEDYISDINSRIDNSYSFIAKDNHKKSIKSSDVIDIVINEFFSIRELTKNQKKLKSLSSGQQRVALIDVATKLLSTDSEKATETILAIDEPESSLDSQHRFEQFSLLMDLAEKYKRNIFITTHWYGLLLRPTTGMLHYIDTKDNNEITYNSYPLTNLYDYRRSFPESLEMKSYFDLMSSVLSIIKKKDVKWIICEGYEDAIYLNTYLNDDNIIVLPFNGNGNVKKIFEFLSVPFDDKQERRAIKGKVYCLIDTDTSNLIKVERYTSKKFDDKLFFERLGYDKNNLEIKLNSVSSPDATTVTIEDCLNPTVFYAALQLIAPENETIAQYLKHVEFVEGFKYSLINHGIPWLEKKDMDGYKIHPKFIEELSNEKVKYQLAIKYQECQSFIKADTPAWVEDIKNKLK